MAGQLANINTVYQTVLALANKEQRGYITPQEFNLFAKQAQMEIFEQYFFDLDQFRRGIRGAESDFTPNIQTAVEQKLSKFLTSASAGEVAPGAFSIPTNCYKLSTVSVTKSDQNYGCVADMLDHDEAIKILNSGYLTRPTSNRPICYIKGYESSHLLYVAPYDPSTSTGVVLSYFVAPKDPNWTYIVVNEKAIFANNNNSLQNFQLDKSEERNLILKILQLAGIAIKEFSLAQAAAQADNNVVMQQKR